MSIFTRDYLYWPHKTTTIILVISVVGISSLIECKNRGSEALSSREAIVFLAIRDFAEFTFHGRQAGLPEASEPQNYSSREEETVADTGPTLVDIRGGPVVRVGVAVHQWGGGVRHA
jgi:hypothetical protein